MKLKLDVYISSAFGSSSELAILTPDLLDIKSRGKNTKTKYTESAEIKDRKFEKDPPMLLTILFKNILIYLVKPIC